MNRSWRHRLALWMIAWVVLTLMLGLHAWRGERTELKRNTLPDDFPVLVVFRDETDHQMRAAVVLHMNLDKVTAEARDYSFLVPLDKAVALHKTSAVGGPLENLLFPANFTVQKAGAGEQVITARYDWGFPGATRGTYLARDKSLVPQQYWKGIPMLAALGLGAVGSAVVCGGLIFLGALASWLFSNMGSRRQNSAS